MSLIHVGYFTNINFGFQRQHSTNLAVTFFTDSVHRAMDNGQLTGSVLIDLRKAFDMVDHSCLLEKLKTKGVHSQEHVLVYRLPV